MILRKSSLLALSLSALSIASVLNAQETASSEGHSEGLTLAADTQGTPDQRAAQILAQMTLDEKLTLLAGEFGADFPPTGFEADPLARYGSAGYVQGIERLGIPAQWQADAGIGVATQGGAEVKRARTALPSGLAVAASWDRNIARAGGAMIGSEARADGFNVLLGGSVNLLREPRNGRNFEYAGEDPLLAGVMVGHAIAGVQSNDIISTSKHFAVNDQETDRGRGNSVLDEASMRMSDLLAFQISHEIGEPGSVMCAYNRVNGPFSCEHPFLLTQVLREEWGWPGYVLSDWGAVHSTVDAANAGLDQESGYGLQMEHWFAPDKLKSALNNGEIDTTRIDLMAGRILRTMFAHGLIDNPVSARNVIDFVSNKAVSQQAAEAGIVLLKNEGDLLPLSAGIRRIVVIGGHADRGVLSGGGSSQVYPENENAVPGIAPTSWPGPVVYYPSSPLEELRKLLPETEISFVDGENLPNAPTLVAGSDLAIVFATQWASESIDVQMALDGEQDALIAAVSAANPNTIVVLETGGPVAMPWEAQVPAILEAWYPGRMGGAAIARVLTGAVNPSGHLPVTFPVSLDQLPYPGEPRTGDVEYSEGAMVGYKWFAARDEEPLFAFGHGLSYTEFTYSDMTVAPARSDTDQATHHVDEDAGLVVELSITNTQDRQGADVVQLYVSGPGMAAPISLGGFARVDLTGGESRKVTIRIDPRLLASWDISNPGWQRAEGDYTVYVGKSAENMVLSSTILLPALHLPPDWRPEATN